MDPGSAENRREGCEGHKPNFPEGVLSVKEPWLLQAGVCVGAMGTLPQSISRLCIHACVYSFIYNSFLHRANSYEPVLKTRRGRGRQGRDPTRVFLGCSELQDGVSSVSEN